MQYDLATSKVWSGATTRAAQYLRMSSENQRYSTENQTNAIAEYAQQNGYQVVATYIDAGKSGLSLKGRDALKQLLSDALAAQRKFDAVLVYDVSRWGRFQNPDQAAHYEFLCRQAGVRVVYCGEPFGEDVAPITTIVKHLKRVMAGEYSRELSARMSRAKRQQAQLGFRQGGSLIFGFRRLLVDAGRNPKQILKRRERKALSTDKVIVVPGPPEELAVIKRIFRMYVRQRMTIADIARCFAKEGIKGYDDCPLKRVTIRHVLSNELCIGRMTYNLTTQTLQGPAVKNPEQTWTRYPAFDPIIPAKVFRKAQELLRQRANRHWDRNTIMKSLKALLAREGYLSYALISESTDVPAPETIMSYFGSLRGAYDAIAYTPPPISPFGINSLHWSKKDILAGLRNLHREHGHISTLLIDTSSELPSSVLIRRYFGSIPEAMRQAGLPALTHSQGQQLMWKRRKAKGCDDYYHGVHWTESELLGALRQLEEQNGYMSANLLDQNGVTPSAYYFTKRFGSLDKARALANLPPRTASSIMKAALRRKKESKRIIGRRPRHEGQRSRLWHRSDDILAGLKRLAKEKGRVSARLIDADRDLPCWGTVVRHFGSLKAAYELIGLVRLPGKPARFGLPAKASVQRASA
jgi:DNA invertase Pin-like site-specific DNA recombinase